MSSSVAASRSDGLGEHRGQGGPAAGRGERGDAGADREPGLEDAAGHGRVELAVAHQQPGEQVEAGVPPVVAHGRRAAVADLEQAGLRHPLQRLAHGGPGDAQHLGEPAFARQRVADGDLPVDDLGEDLVEHLVRHGAADHGLQRHGGTVARPWSEVKWYDQIASRGAGRSVPWRSVPPCCCVPACWAGTCSRWCWWPRRRCSGFWQVEAWQERRAAEARDLTQLEPVPLTEVLGPDDPFPGDRSGSR